MKVSNSCKLACHEAEPGGDQDLRRLAGVKDIAEIVLAGNEKALGANGTFSEFLAQPAARAGPRVLSMGLSPSNCAKLSMGVRVTYSYEVPNSPEAFTVSVFSPAFFNAGTTSFF